MRVRVSGYVCTCMCESAYVRVIVCTCICESVYVRVLIPVYTCKFVCQREHSEQLDVCHVWPQVVAEGSQSGVVQVVV
jgi:hypothetical protein